MVPSVDMMMDRAWSEVIDALQSCRFAPEKFSGEPGDSLED